jgi:glycosyltransferase involved in cell wall biosynthesis
MRPDALVSVNEALHARSQERLQALKSTVMSSHPPTQKVVLSAVILTKNEAQCIERAIDSVAWADEIVVVDSGSTDATVQLAQAAGAVVYAQDWLGWREQHENAAARARHDWILSIDADEVVTPALARSIQSAMALAPDPRSGFVVDRQEEFLGSLMPNGRRPKARKAFVRLYNRQFGGYDPELDIHEQIRCPGPLIELNGPLLHWRNYSIGRQIDTFNRNADIEARMIARNRTRFSPLALVCKPILRFGWMYILCGNWRRGTKGFVWSVMLASAEFMRQAKAWELLHIRDVPHPPSEDVAKFK